MATKEKTKSRTIYSYETIIYEQKKDQVDMGWNTTSSESLIKLISGIMSLNKEQRMKKDPTYFEWTMHLEKFELDNKTNPKYITGYFHSTKEGIRTNLQNIETGEVKPNPKGPNENEIRTTCFAFRIKDGLFLLGSYSDNVATYKRIADYLTSFATTSFSHLNIIQVSFNTLISKEFLEKINAFERINFLELTVDTTVKTSGTKDAISILDEELEEVNQGKIEFIISRKDANGLDSTKLGRWIQRKINKHHIIKGTLRGKPAPGGRPELRLQGMDERVSARFPVDKENEVLNEHLFQYIINIIETRSTLKP